LLARLRDRGKLRTGGVYLLESFFAFQVLAKRFDSHEAEFVIAQLRFGEARKRLLFEAIELPLDKKV